MGCNTPGRRWTASSAYVSTPCPRRAPPPADAPLCLPDRAPQMYKVHSSAPRVLGRISRVPTSVTLELTPEAVQLGLLEPALVATALLSCGHNID